MAGHLGESGLRGFLTAVGHGATATERHAPSTTDQPLVGFGANPRRPGSPPEAPRTGLSFNTVALHMAVGTRTDGIDSSGMFRSDGRRAAGAEAWTAAHRGEDTTGGPSDQRSAARSPGNGADRERGGPPVSTRALTARAVYGRTTVRCHGPAVIRPTFYRWQWNSGQMSSDSSGMFGSSFQQDVAATAVSPAPEDLNPAAHRGERRARPTVRQMSAGGVRRSNVCSPTLHRCHSTDVLHLK